jgi:hypothetical protein
MQTKKPLEQIKLKSNEKNDIEINYDTQKIKLSDLINQKNYLLDLDELGNPKISQDTILTIEKDTNIILKIKNSGKITKNIKLICDRKINLKDLNFNLSIENVNENGNENEIEKENENNFDINNNSISFNIGSSSFEQGYITSSSQAEDNKSQENIQLLQGDEIEKELSETNSKMKNDSNKINRNRNINNNNKKNNFTQQKNFLSIEELKEIAKVYELKESKFPDYINSVSISVNASPSESDNNKFSTHSISNSYISESDSQNSIVKFDKNFLENFESHVSHPIDCNSDLYFIIPCKSPGPMSFFFAYEKDTILQDKNFNYKDNGNEKNYKNYYNENLIQNQIPRENLLTKEVHILIEPKIKLGKNTEIDLDSISMQTVLSKSLGKLDEWENYFKEANLLKYNFIHFTPIQILGKSDSLYCIKDQREINNIFFDLTNNVNGNFMNKFEKLKLVKSKITQLKSKYKLNCLVDIVLNHTALNSDWLQENPNSGFNLENSPHLNVSWELEKVIMDYSSRFSAKKVECKSAPYINNENDLNELIKELSREIFNKNFEEFFLISIEKVIGDFISYFANYKNNNQQEHLLKKNYLLNKLKEKNLNFDNEKDVYKIVSESADNYGHERYGVKINTEFVSILLLKDNQKEKDFLVEVKKHLTTLNEEWRKKAKDLLNQAVENIRSTAKYEFIDLKRFKVTDKRKIVENYFIYFDINDKRQIFACNGWLWGVNDPTINFAKYGYWNYFNRSIVIWGDCVKLNYGEKFEDSPYLWSHMTEYICQMAYIFDGFRLDNAHSTPIYLGQYLMRKAREVNPNLVVIAELFAGTKEREVKFINKIGINLLIREIIYSSNVNELDENIYKYGGGKEKILGKLDQEFNMILSNENVLNFKKLNGKDPKEIVFDLTHDNPTLYEKHFNLGLNLTFLCCVSMCASSIGSTRGFDQLYPYQPSVVKENRLYSYDEHFEEVLWKNTKFLGKYFDENENENENQDNLINKEKENRLLKKRQKEKEKNLIDNDDFTLFEFNTRDNGLNYSPSKIFLAISSFGWKPDFILDRISNELFRGKIKLNKGTHFYKYIIDGKNWVFDKTKPTIKDGSNIINNVIFIGEININSNYKSDNSQNIQKLDFYINYKDLKIVRRELNYMRKILSQKSEAFSSEIFINKNKDIIFIYRSKTKNSNTADHDESDPNNIDGYAMISRTGFEKNLNNSISANFELPGYISELVFFTNINVPSFDIDKIKSEQKLNGVDGNIFFSKNIQNLYDIANINRM